MNTNDTNNISPDEQPTLPFDPPIEFEPSATAAPQTPDVESLIAENEALRRAVREREARDLMTASLAAAGARSPELLFAAAKDLIQFGEDGSPQNAEALVADLKRRFPEQFGAFSPQPPIDGGAGAGGTAPALTKEVLARMTPAEIARLDWAAVRQALAS